LIDPYKPYKNYDRYTTEELKRAEKIAHTTLNVHANKIKWIKTKSAEATKFIDDESLDFIYIDGNHTYQAVLEDITLYYPKVKKGGMLCGHDYIPKDNGCVFDAVKEFCEKNDLKLHVDIQSTDWWIWK